MIKKRKERKKRSTSIRHSWIQGPMCCILRFSSWQDARRLLPDFHLNLSETPAKEEASPQESTLSRPESQVLWLGHRLTVDPVAMAQRDEDADWSDLSHMSSPGAGADAVPPLCCAGRQEGLPGIWVLFWLWVDVGRQTAKLTTCSQPHMKEWAVKQMTRSGRMA